MNPPNRLPVSVTVPGRSSAGSPQILEGLTSRQVIQFRNNDTVAHGTAVLENTASPVVSTVSSTEIDDGTMPNLLPAPDSDRLLLAGIESYALPNLGTDLVQADSRLLVPVAPDPQSLESPVVSTATSYDGDGPIMFDTRPAVDKLQLTMTENEGYSLPNSSSELVKADPRLPVPVAPDPQPVETPTQVDRIISNAMTPNLIPFAVKSPDIELVQANHRFVVPIAPDPKLVSPRLSITSPSDFHVDTTIAAPPALVDHGDSSNTMDWQSSSNVFEPELQAETNQFVNNISNAMLEQDLAPSAPENAISENDKASGGKISKQRRKLVKQRKRKGQRDGVFLDFMAEIPSASWLEGQTGKEPKGFPETEPIK